MTSNPRRTLAHLIAASIAAVLLLGPASASAEVSVDGTGEPAFTSSSQNTQFIRWDAPSGSDAYRLTAVFRRDGVEVTRQTWNPALRGTSWINWSGVVPLPLEEGRTYAICVSGAYSLPNDSLFFPDGRDTCQDGDMTGRRTATTIDRSKPVVSISAADGAAATRSTLLPVTVTYEDAHSAPFPANFLCAAPGNSASEACDNRIYGYDAGCSRPAASSRSTTFECQVETSGLNPSDGRLFACVASADSAVPDNPNSPNQVGQAGQANISNKVCDSVILDRTPPTAAINTPSTTVTRGQVTSFEAQVSDAHSGLAPDAVRWSWNDGNSPSTGSSTFHAFAAAGTYAVQLEVADAAGNKTVVAKTITVLDPATGGSPPAAPIGSPPATPVDPPTGGAGPVRPSTDAGNAACEAATKKLAKAKTKLAILKRGLAAKGKIKQAKAGVKRAKAATTKACAA